MNIQGNLLDTVHDPVLESSGHDQLNKMADNKHQRSDAQSVIYTFRYIFKVN